MDLFKKINNFLQSEAFAAAGIYTFTNFFAKGVAFVLLFVYSNPLYISVEENGLLSLLSSSILFLAPFVYLGALQSTSTDFFKLTKSEFKDYFTTSFVLPLLVTILSIAIFFIFFGTFSKNFNFLKSFIWLIPVLVFLSFCIEQFVTLIRNNNEPLNYLKVGIFRIIFDAGISIGLVVFFAWHWKGRAAGILISQFVIALLAFFYFKKRGYVFGKVKKKYLKEELIFALPIITMQLSIFSLTASDKFFLAKYENNHAVGVYGYACIFASIVNIFGTALMQYLLPKIYSFLSSVTINYYAIKKHFIIFLGATFAVFALVVLFTPLMYKYFIHESYHPGLKYLYLIALGYFFWGITYFFYSYLLYHKQKRKILSLALTGIFISLLSNWFFIKKYGELGAALSVCFSYFVFLCVTIIFALKFLRKMFSSFKEN